MKRAACVWVSYSVVLWAWSILAGCAASRPSGTSTRLSASDFLIATNTVRESLAASEFLNARTQSSPPLRLMLIPAENKSVERLSKVDRSLLVTLVGTDAGVLELLGSKNVDVSVADDTRATLELLNIDLSRFPSAEPTHYMIAEVRSITRQGGEAGQLSDVRTDLLSVTYRIVEVGSSAAAWADDVLVKRAARGVVAD